MARGGVEVEEQKLRSQIIKQGGVSACLVDQIRMRAPIPGNVPSGAPMLTRMGCCCRWLFYRWLCLGARRYLEFNGLLVSNSLLHDIRPRQSERPDIRLVRGVRPVALIFHLEHVAMEAATRGYAGSDLVTNGLNIFERLRRGNEDPGTPLIPANRRRARW